MSLMAALTGLKFTYVAGVHGEIVPERVLPSGEKQKNVKSPGKIGNWRAHMNVMERSQAYVPLLTSFAPYSSPPTS
jgi:hypothetical protein